MHIRDLLEYEHRTGIRFNQMPSEACLSLLQDELRLPVLGFVHQGPGVVRAVAYNPIDQRCPLLIDMPEQAFDELPTTEVEVDASDVTQTA